MPALAAWKGHRPLLKSAERDFDRLPATFQQAFLDAFPELAQHPWRKSANLDVGPLRDMHGWWRLKVKGGHHGTYRDLPGRPEFEMLETRDEIYDRLRRYLDSRS